MFARIYLLHVMDDWHVYSGCAILLKNVRFSDIGQPGRQLQKAWVGVEMAQARV